MGHIGLTPQTATALGGYKAQGRTGREAERLVNDALDLQRAGCFAIVVEAVPAPVTELLVPLLDCVTIGIGAGGATDGQVLVWHDLLGHNTGRLARFVRTFADLHTDALRGISAYATAVREREFPAPEHTYGISDVELAGLRERLSEGGKA